jgi:hypothetical protein
VWTLAEHYAATAPATDIGRLARAVLALTGGVDELRRGGAS